MKKNLNAVQEVRKIRHKMYEEWRKNPEAFDEKIKKESARFRKAYFSRKRQPEGFQYEENRNVARALHL